MFIWSIVLNSQMNNTLNMENNPTASENREKTFYLLFTACISSPLTS